MADAEPEAHQDMIATNPAELPLRALRLIGRNILLAEHLQARIADGISKKHFQFGPDAAKALGDVLRANDQAMKLYTLFEPHGRAPGATDAAVDQHAARAAATKLLSAPTR